MDLYWVWFWGALVMVSLYLARHVRVASERERFAVHRQGRFAEFKGPGLLLKGWNSEHTWTRLSVGDRGELLDMRFAKIHGVLIPIRLEGGGTTGQRVRVKRFDPQHATVAVDGTA